MLGVPLLIITNQKKKRLAIFFVKKEMFCFFITTIFALIINKQHIVPRQASAEHITIKIE